MSIEGKLVIITGGGRGIGRTIAATCKKAGALVVVAARTDQDLDETLKELKSINNLPCLTAKCDVTKTEDLKKLFTLSTEKFGPIYGLICAAGIYGPIGSFVECNFSDWESAIDINLKGTAKTIHTAYPFMTDKSGGRIVLFSGGGQGAMANFSSYVTSKGAIWRLTETLASELATKNIYVNAIAPGAVNTKLLDDLLSAGPDKVGSEFYQKSIAQKENGGQSPQKAAELCLYLLSEQSTGLFGKTLSAIWDPYTQFSNLASLSKSEIYTVRRVVDENGNTRSK